MRMRTRRWRLGVAALMVAILGMASAARAERTVVDMAGRNVVVPDRVTRVATIGPVPVLNSFVFALGAASSIVNGLPANLGGPRWKLQYLAAPEMRYRPVVQTADGGANAEGVLALSPDAVLAMDIRTVEHVARLGVPAVYLSWRQPEDVKTVMRLLGTLYGKADTAEAYCRYFDATLARVAARVDGLPLERRPRVLFANLKRLTQPHLIAEWWIAKAGGRSVTDNGRTTESLTFSMEQLLAWNPEVLIVSTPAEVADAYADPRLAGVAAVRSKRVIAVPMGAHLWGNRTIEQPLTVLWAAKTFHPDLFADVAIERETADFYGRFFGLSLSPAAIDEILAGQPDP